MTKKKLKKDYCIGFFPEFKQYLYSKDVVQIPYNIGEKLLINSAIVKYNSTIKDESYDEYFDQFAPKLEVISLEKKMFLGKDITLPLFILKNRRFIKVLYYYQFGLNYTYENHLIAIAYKFFNKKGKLHMRFEVDFNHLDSYPKQKSNLIIKLLSKNYYSLIDYIGYIGPLQKAKEIFKIDTKIDNLKIQLNGFNNEVLSKYYDNNLKKENIIILTGRIDIPIKGLDVFIKAIDNIDLKDWKVYLVGGDKLKVTQIVNSNLKSSKNLNNIHIFGFIEYKELYRLLSKSKIYVLSSYFDGMPLAVVEAMACGNMIVSSNHYGMNVALDNGNLGKIFETGNSVELKNILFELINDSCKVDEYIKLSQEKAINEYSWKSIVNNIYK